MADLELFLSDDVGPEVRVKLNAIVTLINSGGAGGGGTGWSPVIAVASDGARRVWQIVDWVGGTGTKPSTGYVGPTGIVSNIAEAVDVRGPAGVKGDKGDKGDTGEGEPGADGSDGWTPVMAVVADGERRVFQISSWTGGTGTPPATGYLGPSGIVANIVDALDVRGASGSGSVSRVNNIDPDGSGNVSIEIEDIPGLEDALANAGAVVSVNEILPDSNGNIEIDYDDVGAAAAVHNHTAEQVSGLADVATSGSYDDLSSTPTLGALAAKSEVAISDIDATGTPSDTTYLRGDGSWETPTGGGGGTLASESEIRALTGNNTVTPSVIASGYANAGTLSDSPTIAVNWSSFINDTVTISANRTLGNPTNVIPGTRRTIAIKGNSSTYRTLAFGSSFTGKLPGIWANNQYFVTLELFAISATEILVTAHQWPSNPLVFEVVPVAFGLFEATYDPQGTVSSGTPLGYATGELIVGVPVHYLLSAGGEVSIAFLGNQTSKVTNTMVVNGVSQTVAWNYETELDQTVGGYLGSFNVDVVNTLFFI